MNITVRRAREVQVMAFGASLSHMRHKRLNMRHNLMEFSHQKSTFLWFIFKLNISILVIFHLSTNILMYVPRCRKNKGEAEAKVSYGESVLLEEPWTTTITMEYV